VHELDQIYQDRLLEIKARAADYLYENCSDYESNLEGSFTEIAEEI